MSIAFNADEVFQIGMEVELNGQAFYEAAAARSSEEQPKEVLLGLAEQEAVDHRVFSRMRGRLPAEAQPTAVYDPDGQMGSYLKALADSRVFTNATQAGDVAHNCETAVDVLDVALQFEKDSVLMFQAMKEMTRPDWGKDKIDGLIRAEEGHIRQISSMKTRLQGGAA